MQPFTKDDGRLFSGLLWDSVMIDLIPITNFVMFPMGILLQKTSALISTQRSLCWLPFSAYRTSSLIAGEVRPLTLMCQLSWVSVSSQLLLGPSPSPGRSSTLWGLKSGTWWMSKSQGQRVVQGLVWDEAVLHSPQRRAVSRTTLRLHPCFSTHDRERGKNWGGGAQSILYPFHPAYFPRCRV